MLDQIISEIREAEKKADEIIANALAEAKEMTVAAEKHAEAIKKDTVEKVKAERKKVVESAEKDAEARYDEILDIGKRSVADLEKNVDLKKEIELIKKKVLTKYDS